MTIIPDWAANHFYFKNDKLTFNLEDEGPDRVLQRKYFKNKREKLKAEELVRIDLSALQNIIIESYVRDYALCTFALALIDFEREKVKNKRVGRHQQHWIPECYMRAFAKKYPEEGKKVEKVRKILQRTELEQVTTIRKNIGRSVLVRLDEYDFCELSAKKGRFYSPLFEVLLSRIEHDYAAIPKVAKSPTNLWDFTVLVTFFIIFSSRTKEQLELFYSESKVENGISHDLLLDLIITIPRWASNIEIFSYHLNSLFSKKEQKISLPSGKTVPRRLPFTQDPFYREKELNGAFSFWCVYTPEILLWLRSKDSLLNPRSKDYAFFRMRLKKAIGTGGLIDAYFHPDDTPWYNDSLR